MRQGDGYDLDYLTPAARDHIVYGHKHTCGCGREFTCQIRHRVSLSGASAERIRRLCPNSGGTEYHTKGEDR